MPAVFDHRVCAWEVCGRLGLIGKPSDVPPHLSDAYRHPPSRLSMVLYSASGQNSLHRDAYTHPSSRQRDFDFEKVAMQHRKPRPSRTRPAATATARPVLVRPAASAAGLRPCSARAASVSARSTSASARPAAAPPQLQLPPRSGAGQEALGGEQDVARPPRLASRWRFAGRVRQKRPEWC